MRLEFYGLAENLLSLSNNKPIIYVSNSGNWGDALIHAGTVAFFKHFEIPYVELPVTHSSLKRNLMLTKAKLKNQLIVLAGGGAWCDHYSHLGTAAKNIMDRYNFKNIVVLPSTYDKPFNIDGFTFYRRDEYESKTFMPHATFCHDMAFFLEPLLLTSVPTKAVANVFRIDVESKGKIQLPEDNYDLSIMGTEHDGIFGFFDYLSKFETINTDRLHVSIGASILGKKVNLYEGSYFKNRAIFLSSLKAIYPNTEFKEYS
ncbi:hypothetical protein QX776_17720 [Alteromonadaceae bacterium BrNp21-10]|nr:hypothetical protein [Alteromonadaceae bacterium BrNp21-10]